MKVWFFLLAGGLGKRALPLTYFKPKPVFPLDGTPLISIMLDQLEKKGLEQGFINLHHLPDAVRQCVEEKKRAGITFLYEEELSGSRILKAAADKMAEDDLLLVVNGDIFLDIPFQEMLDRQLAKETDGVLLARERTGPGHRKYRPLLTRGNRFIGREPFSSTGNYDLNTGESAGRSLMYPGVALLSKKVVRQIDRINFFDSLEARNFAVSVCISKGIWLDIGDPASYMGANYAYKKYKGNEDSDANSLSPGVVISTDSKVKGSIIWENTEITNGSLMENCIVTGNMCLDHVRYENRLVTPSKLQHL